MCSQKVCARMSIHSSVFTGARGRNMQAARHWCCRSVVYRNSHTGSLHSNGKGQFRPAYRNLDEWHKPICDKHIVYYSVNTK